jgi:hypothetical protein
MIFIRQSLLAIAFIVMSLSSMTVANAGNPNFSTETSTLFVPLVDVDGITLFKNARLKLDFATQTFVLEELGNVFTSSSKPFNPMIEVELNDSLADAQLLTAIGANNPVNAAIAPAGDEDWYRFEGQIEQTYVVDLFDADWNLATESGNSCSNYRYNGIGLQVYDQTGAEFHKQCEPNGEGNVHTSLVFKNFSSVVYIRVIPNANTLSGNYKLRVQPHHDDPSAAWDEDSFEPNNWTWSAYAIKPGATNALTSTIETRNPSISSPNIDADTYRFNATLGQTYVVELFNVATSLEADIGNNCSSYNYRGLGIIVYDRNHSEHTKQCEPNGVGNVHNHVWLEGLSGTTYIRVQPNANTVSGSYSIRLLPEHDEPGAVWEPTTFEPNNRIANAYAITPGANHALTSDIEVRNGNFSTIAADVDWYRFEALAGQTYTVELFDVASNIETDSGHNCSSYDYQGLGLIMYNRNYDELLKQCQPNGTDGSIHNSITLKADINGVYYILVLPNANSASGNYSIRVLPQ